MDKIYDKCCGIDVHKKLIVACFRCGKKQEVREFGATTRELLELADWLKDGGCEMVAMESTASYWKPLYNILESSDLNAMVVNARHMKAVPGRKTDVKDAEWIADLLQHGLLQPSYIPDKDQRELRELVRYRKSLVGERTRELNRLQKMLEGANIKLSGTVSDINGKSARSILEYLLTGKSIDGSKYDEMYKQKIIAHRKVENGTTYAMAQLDHFFPRDSFPIFAVSLYNLVPACSACNHIKTTKEMKNWKCNLSIVRIMRNLKIKWMIILIYWVLDKRIICIKIMFRRYLRKLRFTEKIIEKI